MTTTMNSTTTDGRFKSALLHRLPHHRDSTDQKVPHHRPSADKKVSRRHVSFDHKSTNLYKPNVDFAPLSLPSSCNPAYFKDFGLEIKNVDPGNMTSGEKKMVVELLYKHSVLVFSNVKVAPEDQYEFTKMFDPVSEQYGHGNARVQSTQKSILHPDLKTIPRVPQVQLIGNGTLYNHEGLAEAKLKHPSHQSFHGTSVSEDDEKKGVTRFYRWHIDAALYNLDPPKVTTLFASTVPHRAPQVCRYDDGTGDELKVPFGTTAFSSGATMFDILPKELKSVAVRAQIQYAPHPYVWMSNCKSNSVGLGLLSEDKELPLDELPEWQADQIKILPMCWKNPVTGRLHLQVHPSAIMAIIIAPLPDDDTAEYRESARYPDGAFIDDLQEARDLVYEMQRPGIAPELLYCHEWKENDFVVFNNRGVLHSVVGALKPDDVRAMHQCNLAASEPVVGPSEEDVLNFA
ncbi:hypothetical protein SmJEL517_g01193 [Synchytrium microbalum]|uniref:TauD/TfdA-like domain-containing protein n=1 Tax=Synchytrium microbalum TaxID=1806994 RepID=A0A507CGM7_9FUNG|nr:uncharacterized protein SmJEL517_g01193 [Synchytrium microbalum]TPX36673.1 hypothetical protein SmJEL517_g01193 [Synchytrium microbalum]